MKLLDQPSPDNQSVADHIDRLAGDEVEDLTGLLVRHRITRQERATVLHDVFFDSDPRWGSAFVVMLALSAGIATLGLSQNSAATVIGSMIVAPLGSPIVGLGGAIAAVWPRQVARMAGVVLGGALLVVAVSYTLGLLLPNATPDAQILARTSPDLRDLGVAVFAGAAGAYARTRPSQSSALVGVAIAVALVPPLGTIGLMLEEGHWSLAQGAATRFGANFVGITLSAAIVLLVTGFVPVPRFGKRGIGLVAGLASVVALAAVIMAPLSIAYKSALANAAQRPTFMRRPPQRSATPHPSPKLMSTAPTWLSAWWTRHWPQQRSSSPPTSSTNSAPT